MRGRLTRKHVYFEMGDGRIVRPFETFGLRLSTWDITPPKPKIYRMDIEGGDGTLDLTEWAGAVRFEDRTVTLVFRRYNGGNDTNFRLLLGRNLKLRFEDDPSHYYEGRCEDIKISDNGYVTDYTMTLTCKPYRYGPETTIEVEDIQTSGWHEETLRTDGLDVAPVFTAEGGPVWLRIDGVNTEYSAGTFTVPDYMVSQTPQTLQIGAEQSGVSLTINWRERTL